MIRPTRAVRFPDSLRPRVWTSTVNVARCSQARLLLVSAARLLLQVGNDVPVADCNWCSHVRMSHPRWADSLTDRIGSGFAHGSDPLTEDYPATGVLYGR